MLIDGRLSRHHDHLIVKYICLGSEEFPRSVLYAICPRSC